MCRGWIQWWQSRTVSTAPVAGWTSSAGKGSTASAASLSQWTQCDCSTSDPEKMWCPGIWMTPLQSQCCSWWWVGESRGFLLMSTIISTVLSVFSSRLLRLHQTASSLTSLSVSRLVTVLNEADQCGVVCKQQELDWGVSRCAVIGVQGEEQWGENTALRSSSADRTGAGWAFSQPHYLLPVCQEAGDPLTDGGGDGELCQFILKGVRDDGVKSVAEVYK